MEIRVFGLENLKFDVSEEELKEKLRTPNSQRVFYIKYALKCGMNINEIYGLTKIDRWFLYNIKEIVDLESEILKYNKDDLSPELLCKAKEYEFSDK